MTSPNFSEYVDLTIYDLDAFQAYNDAIVYARNAVPDFSPRTGTLEDAIMQAIAYNTALISSQINRLPNGLMEGMARLSGLERLEATFATGTAEFTVFDDSGITIPIGTVVAYEVIDNDIVTSYPFETTADLVIATGFTTGTVAIKALSAGVYPSLLTGQALELVSPAAGVTAVELTASLAIGTNTETDSEYFNRATQHFASLSSALVTKSQMSNYIRANYPNIGQFKVYDLTDSTGVLDWDDAAEPGFVTVVASDTNGNNLSVGDVAILEDDLSAKTVAGLTIGVVNPATVGLTVDVEIVIADGYGAVATRDAVEAYLVNRLSTKGYDYSGLLIKYELISAVSNIPGVRYVVALDLTSASAINLFAEGTEGNLRFLKKNGAPDPTVNVTSA